MEDSEVVEETDTGAPPEEAAEVSNLNEDPNTNSETANPESSYTGSHISEKDTHEVNANETMGGEVPSPLVFLKLASTKMCTFCGKYSGA